MERYLVIRIHRQGYTTPIWGIFPENDPDRLVMQYPSDSEDKACNFFLNRKQELLEQGYTGIIRTTKERISL